MQLRRRKEEDIENPFDQWSNYKFKENIPLEDEWILEVYENPFASHIKITYPEAYILKYEKPTLYRFFIPISFDGLKIYRINKKKNTPYILGLLCKNLNNDIYLYEWDYRRYKNEEFKRKNMEFIWKKKEGEKDYE